MHIAYMNVADFGKQNLQTIGFSKVHLDVEMNNCSHIC